MNQLLSIPKPKSTSYIFWEHALRTAVMFVGTYILLFFGPMFLEGRSRRFSSESSLGQTIVVYLLEHPTVQIGISVAAAIIYNIYTFWKNRKVVYAVGVADNGDEIQLTLTNLYYSKVETLCIPKEDFTYRIESKVSFENEKKQKVLFVNRKTTAVLGIIDTKHFFWSDKMKQIRDLLVYFKETGITPSNKIH